MFPTLIDLGTHQLPLLGETHLFLPAYGVLFALATVMAWWWLLRRGRELGLPEDKVFNLSFYTVLAGIFGAKLLLIVLDWRTYLEHPGEILGTLRSAGVLVGGLIAGTMMFAIYAKRSGLPGLRLLDAAAAPMALAQAIGRLGCFAAGCCWGMPAGSHTRLAITFTDPVAHQQTGVPLHVPLIATQLMQMVNDLILAVVLTWLWRRRVEPDGTVMWIYVLLYSVSRGTIEFWRGDAQRGLFFGNSISTSQLFALLGIALASIMLFRGRRRLQAAEGV